MTNTQHGIIFVVCNSVIFGSVCFDLSVFLGVPSDSMSQVPSPLPTCWAGGSTQWGGGVTLPLIPDIIINGFMGDSMSAEMALNCLAAE